MQPYSHNRSAHTRVTTHAQVIIAAPHRHLFLGDQGIRVVICHGKDLRLSVHRFEHSVGMIFLLFIYLFLKELVILEGGYSWNETKTLAHRGEKKVITRDQAWEVLPDSLTFWQVILKQMRHTFGSLLQHNILKLLEQATLLFSLSLSVPHHGISWYFGKFFTYRYHNEWQWAKQFEIEVFKLNSAR